MHIFKFGGASVKDADGVRNLARIVKDYHEDQLVIVVSAMGKSTNALEEIARNAYHNNSYDEELTSLIKYHHEIVTTLFSSIPDEVTNLFIQLKDYLEMPVDKWEEFYDRIIPFGELLSTTIVHQFIQQTIPSSWADVRQYIKTNSDHTEAEVLWKLTNQFISRDFPKLLKTGPVITQGFIGSDTSGKTTTLGREGSDFTGAIFANCLDAKSLTVWKDVPGLLNADPKVFDSAELFDEISFQEVTELTYYGAKVIHPKTIGPLAQKEIPLFVRSFIHPDESGTKIHQQEKIASKHCFVFKEDQLLVTLRVRDNSFMDEKKLGIIFQALDNANIKINLMHNSALTFSFCMDSNETKLNRVKEYLSKDFQLLYNSGLHLATIKNYQKDSFDMLPKQGEFILEQRTRNNYQVVYRPISN